MKTLTLNNRTFLAWKVADYQERGKRPWIEREYTLDHDNNLCYTAEHGFMPIIRLIHLPPGTYSEPFLLSQVDEERAEGMVSRLELNEEYGYLDYETLIDKGISYCHKSALESFHSWLRANGVMTENPMTKPDATKILGGSPCGADYEALDELKDKHDAYQSQVSKEWVFVEQLKRK